jgi:hypothetical protein
MPPRGNFSSDGWAPWLIPNIYGKGFVTVDFSSEVATGGRNTFDQ